MIYNLELELFQQELTRLSNERDRIDRDIESVLTIIGIITTLAEGSGEEPVIPQLDSNAEAGFTHRVRAILKANPGRAFTAVQIRNAFLELDPEQDPRVTLIHTHNTLKRLSKQGEVDEIPVADGRISYRLKFTVNTLADKVSAAGNMPVADSPDNKPIQTPQSRPMGEHLAELRRKEEADRIMALARKRIKENRQKGV